MRFYPFKHHKRNDTLPQPVRGKRKGLRLYVLPLGVMALLFCIVRFVFVSHTTLPTGQHALVSLTWYGWRVPGESLWGYHRWGYAQPAKGDLVVFAHTDKEDSPLLIGVCRALPGEPIWIDPVRRIVIPARTSPDAQAITVPGRTRKVLVTPYNARLLAYLMKEFEHCQNVTVSDRGELLLGSQSLPHVKLQNDYYWVETPSGDYTFIPHSSLVGKIVYVSSAK